jgi:hypothetical protein
MTKRNETQGAVNQTANVTMKSHVPLSLLIKLAITLAALARKHEGRLARSGYTRAEARALQAQLKRVGRGVDARAEEKGVGKAATRKLHAETRKTAVYRAALIPALKGVALKLPAGAIEAGLLKVGKRRLVPSEMIEWLTRSRSAVQIHEKALRTYLPPSPLKQHDLRMAKLQTALGEQMAVQRGLPQRTQDLAQARVELRQQLQRVWLVARVAFAGDRTTLRQFRQSVELPRKRVKGAKEPQVDPKATAANDDAPKAGEAKAKASQAS